MTSSAERAAHVARYFAAMQRGPDGHAELLGLFAPGAEYVEPFSGLGPHRGHEAIGRFLADAAAGTPPGLTVHVERLDIEGDSVTATWRCEAPIFRTPARGRDLFLIRAGLIHRLETTMLEPPQLRDRP